MKAREQSFHLPGQNKLTDKTGLPLGQWILVITGANIPQQRFANVRLQPSARFS